MPSAKAKTSKLRFSKKFGSKHHANHTDSIKGHAEEGCATTRLQDRLASLESMQINLMDVLSVRGANGNDSIFEQLEELNSFVEQVRDLLAKQMEVVHDAHSACRTLRKSLNESKLD